MAHRLAGETLVTKDRLTPDTLTFLRRAADRIDRRFRQPSYEGLPLCLFLALEPSKEESDGGVIRPEFEKPRLTAIAAIDAVLRTRGVDDMIAWNDAPERTKEEVLGVIHEAIQNEGRE